MAIRTQKPPAVARYCPAIGISRPRWKRHGSWTGMFALTIACQLCIVHHLVEHALSWRCDCERPMAAVRRCLRNSTSQTGHGKSHISRFRLGRGWTSSAAPRAL